MLDSVARCARARRIARRRRPTDGARAGRIPQAVARGRGGIPFRRSSVRRPLGGGVWVGPVRRPRSSGPSKGKGSIHDDAVQKLGFRGGTVAASLHMEQFPLLVHIYGRVVAMRRPVALLPRDDRPQALNARRRTDDRRPTTSASKCGWSTRIPRRLGTHRQTAPASIDFAPTSVRRCATYPDAGPGERILSGCHATLLRRCRRASRAYSTNAWPSPGRSTVHGRSGG